jgi:hypothetical protein
MKLRKKINIESIVVGGSKSTLTNVEIPFLKNDLSKIIKIKLFDKVVENIIIIKEDPLVIKNSFKRHNMKLLNILNEKNELEIKKLEKVESCCICNKILLSNTKHTCEIIIEKNKMIDSMLLSWRNLIFFECSNITKTVFSNYQNCLVRNYL